MKPTEELKEEHKVILRMLKVLEKASLNLEEGKEVKPEVFKKAVDFIRNFADKCHHGKEEDTLFPMMEKYGIPREGGPLGVMLYEHTLGRNYVKVMAEAVEKYEKGDKSSVEKLVENARGYAGLLAPHIFKEDNILYVMADRSIPEKEQKILEEKFEKIEKEVIGEGKHHEYLNLVEEMEKIVGL
ncbi:MAG TPA: hemerythrin domain-containing protein [Terriglobales bacterium]|nr:hemerythrin domain-containing protein [Terriglobales bacterium]